MGKHLMYFVLFLLIFSCKERKVPYKKDTTSIQNGAKTFDQNCASCHNFKNNSIGPNLSGVTSEVDYQWLSQFIQDPQKKIAEKDQRALQIFSEYKTVMPSFKEFTATQIAEILAYIHSHKAQITSPKKQPRKNPIANPIAETIKKNGSCLHLDFFMQAPATASKKPLARVNKLVPLSSENNRLFYSDLNGLLYEIKNNQTQLVLNLKEYFKNLITSPGLATGLGSFAFHPDYEVNGLLYTTHTESYQQTTPADFSYHDSIPKKIRWILTEWKQTKPSNTSFKGSHRQLLSVDMPTQLHGIQEISFNPSVVVGNSDYGKLYVCIGDGGSAQNQYLHLTQSTQKIWGTILRIDPLGNNSKNGNYGIPKDNPFVKDKTALGEIWAYGFRNPNRISWDPKSCIMLASDIGHKKVEEINLIESGKNYGWPLREGLYALFPLENMDEIYKPEHSDSTTYTAPVLQFDRDNANAVCGGYVYQGNKINALQGKYVFGSIVKGKIFAADMAQIQQGQQANIEEFEVCYDEKISSLKELTKNNRVDLRLGIDGDGELYIATKADGKIYTVVAVN